MLDLDAIEARAEYKLAHLEGQGISLRDITWTLQDVLNLVAELRVAREVVEAAHKWKSALTWDAEWSIRPAEVGSTLQRKSELLEALAAPAGAHVHYDDFYDPAGELDDDFDAYRAVVGAGMKPTQQDTLDFVRSRWPDHVSPQARLNKLGEEYGEVVGAFVKMGDGTGRKTLADLAQETAQLVICAMALAEAAGFDLETEIEDEWWRAGNREWPRAVVGEA
jgi:NTP pyrophosphatase (non-canonical NTP hydrolase)